MPSNPVPRAALSKTDGAVARPALRRRTPLAVPETPPVVVAPPVEAPASKAKGKKGHKETAEVVVVLAKPVRRALKAAAAERETTPEALASLVLTAWLER
jgi:hypothetical protein